MSFEEQLQQQFNKSSSEKTYVDKLLSRKDVEKMNKLMQKSPMTRKDLSDLFSMVQSTESKLYNLGGWDRYVLNKYYNWLNEMFSVAEGIFDYEADMGKKKITDRTKKIFTNVRRHMEHNIKFCVGLYMNICRTSLSLGGTGILEMLHTKFEVSYPQGTGQQQNLSEKTQTSYSGVVNK